MHLVITDSGLGGLSICAAIEQELRAGDRRDVHITYVNAWPEQGQGYNDLVDMAARAHAFDRVLGRIEAMAPDFLLIGCNTLSILYELTDFHRAPSIPVQGIIDAGVNLFHETLSANPASSIVLLGTRTTIESGAHRARLLQHGISADRVSGASCHGLATAIERGPESPVTAALIDTCAEHAAGVAPAGDPLYLGLCCTHYGMIGDRMAAAVAQRTGRITVALDPNVRLVREIVPRIGATGSSGTARGVIVRVISKVELTADQRQGVGDLVGRISPATAEALRTYTHVPDLF